MPIRLRLAVAFAVIAAAFFALGGWLFASGLSSDESIQGQVARELAVGGAVFVAVAGLGAYRLARAALSPVERLRRQVAAISARDEASQVEVPPTRDEVAALAGTMNELLARLQRALARQRAFVADASHELRTPLAVLRGELELASRPGRDRDELAAAVRSAAAEAERLARLTDDLLLLARSDEDRLSLRRERTDIGELLARSAGLAGSRLAAAGIACRVDIRAGTYADVDADRIRQAVDNLVDNALRFAPGDRRSCSRPSPTAPILTSRSVMPGRAFRTVSCRMRSSGSGAQTPAGRAVTGVPDWGSRSSRPSPRRTAEWRRPATVPAAAPWWPCICPVPSVLLDRATPALPWRVVQAHRGRAGLLRQRPAVDAVRPHRRLRRGIRPSGHLTSMVVTTGLWLTPTCALGSVAWRAPGNSCMKGCRRKM